MSMSIPEIQGTALLVTADLTAESLALSFSGTADMSAVDSLDSVLASAHDDVCRARTPVVVVDFRDLEFMNSSCFKCFVTWLGKVTELAEADRYRIVVKANRERHWQKRSLNALRSFALDVVSIQ